MSKLFQTFQFLDENGAPLTSGKLYWYAKGTSTPQAVYADSDESAELTQPVVLDGSGCAAVYLSENLDYKLVIKDQNDVLVRSIDGISGGNYVTLDPGADQTILTGSLLPDSTDQDLGSEAKPWGTLHLADGLHVSAGSSERLTVDATNYINVLSRVRPLQPAPENDYPLGNDLAIEAAGPADIRLKTHKAACTTTTSLAIGANANVPVSSVIVGDGVSSNGGQEGTTSLFSNENGMPLLLGRGTANYELVPWGSWSIVDDTHLNITCTKVHSGTTDIEQIGTVFMDNRGMMLTGYANPAQQATKMPWAIIDKNGSEVINIPTDSSASGLWGMVEFIALLTGGNSATKDLVFRNQAATSRFMLQNAAGSSNIMFIDDSGNLSIIGNMVAGGSLKVGGGTTIVKIKQYTPSLTPSAVGAASAAEQTFNSITGLLPTDYIFVNAPTPTNSAVPVNYRAGTDSMTVTFINPTAGSLTPASGTFKILAFSF